MRIVMLLAFGVALAGCDSTGLYAGCDVSCRKLFECAFNAPNAVPGCTNECVNQLSEESDACKEATAALGECGRNLTCDDFAAGGCSAESTASTNACNGTGIPDAGVDAPSGNGSYTVALDRPTIQTALGRQEPIEVTLTSVDGFDGFVEVHVVVGATTTLAWPISMNPRFDNVPAGGSVSTTFVINIPTDAGVTDTVAHVHAAFLGTTVSGSATLQIDPRVTIKWLAGTGTGTSHPAIGPNTMTIKAGTQIVWVNEDSIPHIVWGDGPGILHQGTAPGSGEPGTIYTVTPTLSGRWYCHSHELGSNSRTVTVVP